MLQCYIEQEICTNSSNVISGGGSAGGIGGINEGKFECSCHRNYILLFFPSFMMFGSESSQKIVLRMCIMEELINILGMSTIDMRLAATRQVTASWHMEKKQYVDRQYICQIISECVTDHFMICLGVCAEMRSILRITGASNRSFEFVNLVSTIIGHSTSPSSLTGATPEDDVIALTNTTCVSRLQHIIKCLTSTHKWEEREEKEQSASAAVASPYCPTCQMYIHTLFTMITRLCPSDNMYSISHR